MKLRNIGKKYGAKIAVGTSLAVASVSSFAALPTAIGTSLTAVETDGLALVDLVWPVVISLFGATLLIKLFKRFASKI